VRYLFLYNRDYFRFVNRLIPDENRIPCIFGKCFVPNNKTSHNNRQQVCTQPHHFAVVAFLLLSTTTISRKGPYLFVLAAGALSLVTYVQAVEKEHRASLYTTECSFLLKTSFLFFFLSQNKTINKATRRRKNIKAKQYKILSRHHRRLRTPSLPPLTFTTSTVQNEFQKRNWSLPSSYELHKSWR
jgi:hypothetical protein